MAGMGSDPLVLAGRVFEQVVDRLAPEELRDGAGEMPADELVAAALGNRLAQMISSDDESPQTEGWDREPGWRAHYRELLDRDGVVAAALGACQCWGEDRGCPICDGLGGPGWALPDEQLFAAYVQPAVDAASLHATQAATAPSVTDKWKVG